MVSRTGYGLAGLLVLAAGLGLTPVPANAQAVPPAEEADAPATEATKTDAAADPGDADIRDLELD